MSVEYQGEEFSDEDGEGVDLNQKAGPPTTTGTGSDDWPSTTNDAGDKQQLPNTKANVNDDKERHVKLKSPRGA